MNQPVKIIKRIVVAFLPMLIVFVWDTLVNGMLDIYGLWQDLDIPMHVIGGFVTAWSWCRLYESYRREYKLTIRPRWLFAILIIGLSASTAVLWELYEFIIERMTTTVMQASIADTVGDEVNGIVGATVFTLCFLWLHRKSTKRV